MKPRPARPTVITPLAQRPKLQPAPARSPALPGNNQTVQPFLIEGLVLGGLALGAMYGGYRYYRHRRRENAIANIRQEQAALAPHIVHHPNEEVHLGPGRTSTATTVNPAALMAVRQYEISINLDDPVGSGGTSRSLIESARVHERTHVAADRGYTENLTPNVSQQIFHAGHYHYHTYPICDRANRLLQAIASDSSLSDVQRGHLRSRVKENSVKPNEWDSTINELLVYTREEGIAANSSTVKLLVVYANENIEHRSGRLARLPRLTARNGNQHHQQQEQWAHL